jgi:phospholipase/carboxylesterase
VPCEALALAEEALELNGVPVGAYSHPGLGHGIDQEGLQLCTVALVQHLFPETLAAAGTSASD